MYFPFKHNVIYFFLKVLLSLIFLGIISCKKEEKCLYDKVYKKTGACLYEKAGEVDYTINGIAYTDNTIAMVYANTYPGTENTLTIQVFTYINKSKNWEYLRTVKLAFIPAEQGKHIAKEVLNPLDPLGSSGTSFHSVDYESRPLKISYMLDPESEDSYVEITNLDLENLIVHGRFDMTYTKRPPKLYPEITDTLHIIGEFKVPLNTDPP